MKKRELFVIFLHFSGSLLGWKGVMYFFSLSSRSFEKLCRLIFYFFFFYFFFFFLLSLLCFCFSVSCLTFKRAKVDGQQQRTQLTCRNRNLRSEKWVWNDTTRCGGRKKEKRRNRETQVVSNTEESWEWEGEPSQCWKEMFGGGWLRPTGWKSLKKRGELAGSAGRREERVGPKDGGRKGHISISQNASKRLWMGDV